MKRLVRALTPNGNERKSTKGSKLAEAINLDDQQIINVNSIVLGRVCALHLLARQYTVLTAVRLCTIS